MSELVGFIFFAALCVAVGFGAAYGIYVVNPDLECRSKHNTFASCEMVWVPSKP
jgi:hypothetical protein